MRSPMSRTAGGLRFWRAIALLVTTAFTLTPSTRAATIQMLGSSATFPAQFDSVNISNGSISAIGNTNAFYTDFAFSPTGILVSATTSLFRIDPATGLRTSSTALQFIGGPGTDLISGVTFSPSGVMYGIGNGNGNLWVIDPVTARAQFIGSSGQSIFAVEFGPGGKLFGAGFNFWGIDPASGAATQIGRIAGAALIVALDYASNGLLYGVSNRITTDSLYTINPQTGVGTLIGQTGGNLGALASFAVPEPGGLVLLGIGVLAIVGFGRLSGRPSANSQSG